MKPIAIYARVSTAKQEEEQTIQAQLNVLREYTQKNGYTVVREYTDEGWSGDNHCAVLSIKNALDRRNARCTAKKYYLRYGILISEVEIF